MKDPKCFYCGKETNEYAGDPSEWPVVLGWIGGEGKTRTHCQGCVMKRLHERDGLKHELTQTQKELDFFLLRNKRLYGPNTKNWTPDDYLAEDQERYDEDDVDWGS